MFAQLRGTGGPPSPGQQGRTMCQQVPPRTSLHPSFSSRSLEQPSPAQRKEPRWWGNLPFLGRFPPKKERFWCYPASEGMGCIHLQALVSPTNDYLWFLLPALFYTHPQLLRLWGFGFFLSFPAWGSQGGGKGDKETLCWKTKQTQGTPSLGRGDERALLFDNKGVWVSLIKLADTRCWAAQNTGGRGDQQR